MLELRDFSDPDWAAVARIYAEGIATGHATFEAQPKSRTDWTAATRPDARLVAVLGGDVVGWATLAAVSARAVYAGVAEVSVYVGCRQTGRGIGLVLLEGLIERSESIGVWTLQAGVFPENRASLALHERCGFRRLGVRQRIGRMPHPAGSQGEASTPDHRSALAPGSASIPRPAHDTPAGVSPEYGDTDRTPSSVVVSNSLAGRWRDVVLLERRSQRVGLD